MSDDEPTTDAESTNEPVVAQSDEEVGESEFGESEVGESEAATPEPPSDPTAAGGSGDSTDEHPLADPAAVAEAEGSPIPADESIAPESAAAAAPSLLPPAIPPSVLIPIAPGTNRNEELALAFRAAGAAVLQYPLQGIRDGEVKLRDHQILALPGGFSYGDALSAGRLLALDLVGWFGDQLQEALDREMPMIGICNGFQALVKAGVLPGGDVDDPGLRQTATLTANANGRFECRWVTLAPAEADSIWTADLDGPVRCPVAHGEGRFVSSDLDGLEATGAVAFRYAEADGTAAAGRYPANPNGSPGDVAGIVDRSGLVMGLMPHPEDHVFDRQDPHRRRGLGGGCLPLFAAGVRAAAS